MRGRGKLSDETVELLLEPTIERLTDRAYEAVVEHFCQKHCGRTPNGNFCGCANFIYQRLKEILVQDYARNN